MKSISCLFFLVLILAIWPRRILAHGGDKNNHPDDLLSKVCAKMPYKDLCVSSLKEDDEIRGISDLHNVARIAVKVAWIIASETQDQMKTMLNTTTSVPYIQQCLVDCDATYDDAIANLEESLGVFDMKGGYGDIVTWVAAAMVDPQTCEDYFKDIPGYSSPVTSMNNVVMQLCSNALALTKLVADGKN